jgi:hypothetical protein
MASGGGVALTGFDGPQPASRRASETALTGLRDAPANGADQSLCFASFVRKRRLGAHTNRAKRRNHPGDCKATRDTMPMISYDLEAMRVIRR